jgi:hypothetical protein
MAAIALPTSLSLLGWYNVRSYGAAGNGTTDDSAAIQAAINAAQAAGGGLVYLPPGTYLQGSAITVAGPNINIIGAGAWATTIVTATSGNAWTISGQGSIAGFSIGPKVTRSVGVYEFAMRGVADYRISDIDIRPQGSGVAWGVFDFSGTGGSGTNFISRVSTYNTPRFLNLDNASDLYIDQCIAVSTVVNGTAAAMIAIEGSGDVEALTVSDCDFVSKNSSNTCILHSSNAGFVANKFSQVYFDSAPAGVIIDNGSQLDFINCWWSNRPGDEMVVNGGNNVHVIGGQASDAGGRAFYLNGGWGHLIQGCSIIAAGSGGASPAIEISSSCTGARILGNNAAPTDGRYTGSISAGLLIGSGATNILADQNDFHLCTASITNNASGTSSVKVGTNL